MTQTIAAIATANLKAGIGIIRMSGPKALAIAKQIAHKTHIPPRQAITGYFYDVKKNQAIDFGLILYFPAPHSFTGEEVIELHGHGNPVLLNYLLEISVDLGCQLARPGEFSQRAFLNNKIDLTQAEAIADLIHAQSTQAARHAFASLQGRFAQHIEQLQTQLTELRVYVEAAIDFPDEDIDFLADGTLEQEIQQLSNHLEQLIKQAKQSALLQTGISIVIAGEPNAGKSSLINLLSGEETAIVTDIAGTTRDLVKTTIQIDGLPIQIIDTAGVHQTEHPVEQQGIAKALNQMQQADLIILLNDISRQRPGQTLNTFKQNYLPEHTRLLLVNNKTDLLPKTEQQKQINRTEYEGINSIAISAKHHQGITALKQAIKQEAGLDPDAMDTTENKFSARQRHINALNQVQQILQTTRQQFQQNHYGELVAEDLRQAQHVLDEITGKHTSDQLLGEIFAGFCIGK